MEEKVLLMDEAAMQRAIQRISFEIIERNKGAHDLALMGIFTRGVPLAERIAQFIFEIEGKKIQVGKLDISKYRDDLTTETKELERIVLPFDVQNKTLIMVDDVLFRGRTARAAMDALMDVGRAAQIQLAVMIDRGHRELPIKANYVGKNVPTSLRESVFVYVKEIDGKDEVCLKEDAVL